MGIPYKQKWSAIRSDAKHIYDKNIFNADFFAPNEDAHYSEAKAKLGELLFFDPILSDNNLRSCASCHKPAMAYTDGLAKSMSLKKQNCPGMHLPLSIQDFRKNNSGICVQLLSKINSIP